MYLRDRKFSIDEKPLHITGEAVEVVALYGDMRNFSVWSLDKEPQIVADVIDAQNTFIFDIIADKNVALLKFLGDGFLLVWEIADGLGDLDAITQSLNSAFEFHKKFWYYSEEFCLRNRGYGIGISFGKVIKVQPETFFKELNEPDFVGYALNSGARLQGLAGPYGVVIDSNITRIASVHETILRDDLNASLRFELLNPEETQIKKAAGMKGLNNVDRTGFKYVVWPYMQHQLWRVDGRG